MNRQPDEPRSAPNDLGSSWLARPWTARAIRTFVFLAPLTMSIGVAWGISAVAPPAASFTLGLARWVVIAAVSTLVLMAVDKVVRRLLPLATLYGLTLAFPDQAPSRYHMALRKGSTTQLRTRIAEARAGKLGDTPEEAAERVLELVMALSVHDRLTRGHSERVRAYTQMIGEEMGLTAVELDRIRWAGLLHDIGKLMISGDILNKPGKLTDDEFETIKQHPEFGRKLVAPLADWLGDAARAVWEHHERWDGTGYPRGLANTDISLAGRIVSVADAYDVMTSARSYKKSVAPAEARAELARCSGTQFDPVVVRAFLNLSLGRLRFALGPISWLAQLPLLPTAFAAGATQVTATAATAVVGAAAASTGLGLSGEPVLPSTESVQAESIATSDDGDRDGVDAREEERSFVVTFPPLPTIAPLDSAPAADDAGAAASGPTDVRGGGSGAATTTTPNGVPVAVTVGPTTTGAPGAGGVATTTIPSVSATTTTAPPPQANPTTSTTAAPSTTTAVPSTTATTTATTTTLAPAAPPTTTPPPRPGWLPPAGQPTPLYLSMRGRIDLPSMPVLGLATPTPTKPNANGVDPDRDGIPGLTIPELDGSEPDPQRAVVYAWGGPDQFHVAGPASAVVHVRAAGDEPVALMVRGRLMACDSMAADAACALLSTQMTALATGAEVVTVSFDFGTVDAFVQGQGSIRLVLDVPVESAGDAVLLADTAITRGALTVTFA